MKTFRVCLGVKKGAALPVEEVSAFDGEEALRIARSRIGKRRGAAYADALEVLAIEILL